MLVASPSGKRSLRPPLDARLALHPELPPRPLWTPCGGRIRGVGFDSTCSLVALDSDDGPVTVSPTGADEQNVIVWMDHRALEQAERIAVTGHDVLRYVGSTMSPEMETPKLLWLKENLPDTWNRTARFFDLPDFLTYRATGRDVRSLCSTVCKWTYLGHETDGGWNADYFESIGLSDLASEGFERIGTTVAPIGERVGTMTETAAIELGLAADTPVAASIIDAHAGGLGLLGTSDVALEADDLGDRLALIAGTSSCHMAVSPEPRFIEGIWGPYYSAMVPGLWLTEGGQSATGALIDHVVFGDARSAEVKEEADRRGVSAYEVLNDRLDSLAASLDFPALLTAELHVQPDFHGNRSPRADPRARGMVSGLRLSNTIDDLAVLYLATIQAVAHGTRHIVDEMNARGYEVDTLVICGGDTRNPVFVREHADIIGLRLVIPQEPEAVLLGSAMMGAVAAGDAETMIEAMTTMSAVGHVIEPTRGEVAHFHERKHHVFHRMYEDQLAYRALMERGA